MEFLIIVFPFLIVAAHLVGLITHIRQKKHLNIIHSFASGFSIAYVFAILLPEIDMIQNRIGIDLFIFTLLGFVFFHIAHKLAFISEHDNKDGSLADWSHIFIIGMYNFLLSFALMSILKENPFQGFLMMIIILVHSSLSEFIRRISTKSETSTWKILLIMISCALGSFWPILGPENQVVTSLIIAVAAGAIVYVSIREEIPNEVKGRPIAFLLGILVIVLLTI